MIETETICPYTGLRSFTEEESLYFKGREDDIDRATEQLQRNKFLMLTGASGDGKSSLIFAGIIPNARAGFLKSKYSQWCVADFRPERSPFHNLCKSLARQLDIPNIQSVEAELNHRVLGSTIDDAAGECFDKTAKLIGLAYPGGPQMDRLAETGDPRRFDFPRPKLRDADDDFSFSGLKTSVRYFLRDNAPLVEEAQAIRDLCASVQAAIVEVLVAKTIRAARREGVRCVTASGGVTANRALRRELSEACATAGLALRVAVPSLCTDNAAMIGILAGRKFLRAEPATSLDADIAPGLAVT